MPIRPTKEDQLSISISESVRLLDEKFPHLRDVTWSETEDRKARAIKRRLEQEEKKNENT